MKRVQTDDASAQAAPRMWPALTLDEQDQVPRLRRFREMYPHVVIGTLGNGRAWQGRIPEEDGEVVVTRYLLGDLLDRLAVLLGEPEASQ